jgi:hypothetical protein
MNANKNQANSTDTATVIYVNAVVYFSAPGEKDYAERVLYVSPSGDDIVTIRIPDYMVPGEGQAVEPLCDGPDDGGGRESLPREPQLSKTRKAPEQVVPIWRKALVLEAALERGEARILEDDPYARYLVAETELSEQQKHGRNLAWDLIQSLVTVGPEAEPGALTAKLLLLFDPHTRGAIIAAHAKEMRVHKTQIYKHLRRYFQGGQVMNALVSQFDRCGGRGKERFAKPDGPKLGRKRRVLPARRITGRYKDAEVKDVQVLEPQIETVQLTATVKAQFRRGIKFFETHKNCSLIRAHRHVLRTFYMDYEEKINGRRTIVLKNERPSFRQFEHFFYTQRNIDHELRTKYGARQYNRRHRKVTGSSQ